MLPNPSTLAFKLSGNLFILNLVTEQDALFTEHFGLSDEKTLLRKRKDTLRKYGKCFKLVEYMWFHYLPN